MKNSNVIDCWLTDCKCPLITYKHTNIMDCILCFALAKSDPTCWQNTNIAPNEGILGSTDRQTLSNALSPCYAVNKNHLWSTCIYYIFSWTLSMVSNLVQILIIIHWRLCFYFITCHCRRGRKKPQNTWRRWRKKCKELKRRLEWGKKNKKERWHKVFASKIPCLYGLCWYFQCVSVFFFFLV